ncbi:hypothetical protein [Nonomuraea sp. NPDC049709]|uniref:hypothetical protein n=1 Tax=Nonomuraea sp. NPDC049709 TaxID=3154736 RepID=UPI00343B4EEE
MSMYEQQNPVPLSHVSRRHADAGRPGTLTGAVAVAIGAAGLNLISAIGILTGGMEAVKEQIAANSGQGSDPVTPEMVDPGSERAQSLYAIYSSLGYSTIFWSLVLVLLAVLALRGGRVTRIFSTVILAISVLVKAADPFIAMPVISVVADVPFVVLALVAVVLFFRPASNAFRKTSGPGTA